MEMPQQQDEYVEGLKQEAVELARQETEMVQRALKEAKMSVDFERITADLGRSVDGIFAEKLKQSGDKIEILLKANVLQAPDLKEHIEHVHAGA